MRIVGGGIVLTDRVHPRLSHPLMVITIIDYIIETNDNSGMLLLQVGAHLYCHDMTDRWSGPLSTSGGAGDNQYRMFPRDLPPCEVQGAHHDSRRILRGAESPGTSCGNNHISRTSSAKINNSCACWRRSAGSQPPTPRS